MTEEHELSWTPLYACTSEAEAEVVVSYLAGNNIEAMVGSSFPYTVFPVNVAGEGGEHLVYVQDADVKEATRLIKQRSAEEAPEETPSASDE